MLIGKNTSLLKDSFGKREDRKQGTESKVRRAGKLKLKNELKVTGYQRCGTIWNRAEKQGEKDADHSLFRVTYKCTVLDRTPQGSLSAHASAMLIMR